jgi:imidazolonepropionase-like amidohydrolase
MEGARDILVDHPIQDATDDEMRAIVTSAHTLGLKVAAHAHGARGIEAAARAGVDSIEHGSFMDEAGAKALAPNLWPYFRRLARKRPTLLIRGATSDLLGADIAARMRKAAPDMRYAEVPGVGHAPMLDEAEAKAAIFDFLRDVP